MPPESSSDSDNFSDGTLDETLDKTVDPNLGWAIDRLHQLTVWGRWLTVAVLWGTVGLWSLWQLRKTWETLRDYFTWSAIRVGLIFHPIAAIGLALCIGMTLSVLIWQSRNVIWGLPDSEQASLKRRVLKIQQQGPSHPLWRWVWDLNSGEAKP
jgi:hypothetical protein